MAVSGDERPAHSLDVLTSRQIELMPSQHVTIEFHRNPFFPRGPVVKASRLTNNANARMVGLVVEGGARRVTYRTVPEEIKLPFKLNLASQELDLIFEEREQKIYLLFLTVR